MLNAVSTVKQQNVGSVMNRLHAIVHALWTSGTIVPRAATCDFAKHVKRCFNKEADALATQAIQDRKSRIVLNSRLRYFPRYIKLCFDEGKRGDLASCGWVVCVANALDEIGEPRWQRLIEC